MELELPDAEEARKSALNGMVAVTVVILSVAMAISKIKDDNIVQSMQVMKSDTVDTWAEYQSKRLKMYINDAAMVQSRLALAAGNKDAQTYADKYEKKIAELGKESDELKEKAKGMEKQYELLGYRDDQFDLADALLSIAVAVSAVASLTEKRSMLWLGWLFGGGGIIFAAAGFAGWELHPDWIIKLLT